MVKYNITPCSKPRMTQADKWKKRPVVVRYWAFKNACKEQDVHVPQSGASITFYVPMPKSWNKKKKAEMDGKPHTQTPDLDNYLKGLLDAVYQNDSHIYHLSGLAKYWAYEGAIEIKEPTKWLITSEDRKKVEETVFNISPSETPFTESVK